MKNDILEKLKCVVSLGKYDESVVMYIFIEIRKLAEQGEIKNYNSILFMADWVVHYRMSYKPTRLLLVELENDISRNSHGSAIINLVNFQKLKLELIRFFESYNINIAKLQANWQQFSTSLVDIISDCPLENVEGKIITKFMITKRDGINYEYHADIVLGSLANLGPKFKNIATLNGILLN